MLRVLPVEGFSVFPQGGIPIFHPGQYSRRVGPGFGCRIVFLQLADVRTDLRGEVLVIPEQKVLSGTGEFEGTQKVRGVCGDRKALFLVNNSFEISVFFREGDQVDASGQPFLAAKYCLAIGGNGGRVHQGLPLPVVMCEVEMSRCEGPDIHFDLIAFLGEGDAASEQCQEHQRSCEFHG